ncbi:glycosyltransferase family 4 protein [Thermococcus sp. LS2]|uniref:glycosyltransferase family 4 protein n=1 Tax=Thermococcus sp. LS2 TaxID=1638260 RepID=UPI00143B33B0|nr:glycosyltransferase family 4 protein [Thermococcus sp. LS2]NJE12849.1 glycosyltransferase [Thermococcus sp. LS2]
MKILQVVHGFPPKQRAGTEIYTYYLSKELAKRYEVHVFYPTRDKTEKSITIHSFERENLHLHELIIPNRPTNKISRFWDLLFFENTYMNKEIEEKFRELLKEITPDIIHFEHLIGLSATLIGVAKEFNIPTILTLHDYWFMCPTIQLLKWDHTICKGPESSKCRKCWIKKQSNVLAEALRKYYIPKHLTRKPLELILRAFNPSEKFEKRNEYLKFLLLKVDKIIAPSRFLREMFIKYEIPEDKVIYSENGYNLGEFKKFKKKKKDTDKIIFGFAGSVIPIKGVHLLIDAFLEVPEDKAELRIYGNYDPKSSYVRKLFSKIRGKSNIYFLGKYDDPKVPFSEVDILVFPSISYENCPLVLAEARATKTPVIASDLGAIPEFVEGGKTGLLFEPNNPKDLYEKITQIIENPELIEKFKSNIKPPKSIEEQAKELERIYHAIISKRLEMV